MKKTKNNLFGWKVGLCFSVIAAIVIFAGSVSAQSGSGNQEVWDYKFTEIVQFKVIGGVPRPQFALVYRNPPTTSVGDTLSFTADVSGVDTRGNEASGTMHGNCTATGVEQRSVPTCARRNPDGSCAILDPLSPLFLCQQVFRLNDAEFGVDGVSQLTIQGFVRQLEAAGDPPGQGQRSQYLAITGGTGRFEGVSGMVKYDLRDNPAPPPIKDLEIYIRTRR